MSLLDCDKRIGSRRVLQKFDIRGIWTRVAGCPICSFSTRGQYANISKNTHRRTTRNFYTSKCVLGSFFGNVEMWLWRFPSGVLVICIIFIIVQIQNALHVPIPFFVALGFVLGSAFEASFAGLGTRDRFSTL